MPTFASVVQSVRHRLARWLVPEIRGLLLESVDDETNASRQAKAQPGVRQPKEAPSGISALPQQHPPDDWLALVREGAPQLLIDPDAGGVPVVQREQFGSGNSQTAADAQADLYAAGSADQRRGFGQAAAGELRGQESSARGTSEAAPGSKEARNAPRESEQPASATRPSRAGQPLSPPIRERIANALHAAARAVSRKESQLQDHWQNAAANFGSGERLSREGVDHRDRPQDRKEADRLAASQPESVAGRPTTRKAEDWAGAHIDAGEGRATHQTYGRAISGHDLRPTPLYPTTYGEDGRVSHSLSKRRWDESADDSRVSAGSGPQFQSRQSRTIDLQQAAGGTVDRSLQPPARQNIYEKFVTTAREVQVQNSHGSTDGRTSASADVLSGERRPRRTPANRWPALLGQPRERPSLTSSLQIQQRQTMLKREQSGAD